MLQLEVPACAKQMKSIDVLISQRLMTMQQSPRAVVGVFATAEPQMSLLTMHALHACRRVQMKRLPRHKHRCLRSAGLGCAHVIANGVVDLRAGGEPRQDRREELRGEGDPISGAGWDNFRGRAADSNGVGFKQAHIYPSPLTAKGGALALRNRVLVDQGCSGRGEKAAWSLTSRESGLCKSTG